MSLFPLIDAPDTGTVPAATLPLAREIAWDFVRDQPIWRAGRPVYVTGAGAVLVWAWNCIHTERFRYDVFTTDYGQDLSGLIGQPYGDDIRQSEAIRTIREALMIHPYITAVDQVSARFEGTLLKISISSMEELPSISEEAAERLASETVAAVQEYDENLSSMETK